MTYGKNAEGYRDPTASAAIESISREEKAARNRPAHSMKKVFICARYRADENHTVESAISSALFACGRAIDKGCVPIAPHVYIPRCLNDDDPVDRAKGMAIGRELLKMCDEVWQWGKTVTEGMAVELAYAKQLGIPIKVFNTIGIPYEQWNSTKFADVPEAQEFLKWEEKLCSTQN